MRAYNVDIFDRSFLLRYHYNVSGLEYKFDYLSPDANVVFLPSNATVSVNDYILITGESKLFGVISTVEQTDGSMQTVNYVSFEKAVFDAPILFDTDLQGVGTFENALATIIERYWVDNSDSLQNIYGLSVNVKTSTVTGWGLNLKSDVAEQHHIICNFFNTFIARGMEKYQVRVSANVDVENQTIILDIEKVDAGTFYLEADLKNVISKNIMVKETDETAVNKLVVWNSDGYNASRTYYKYSTGGYGMTDENRITPVVFSTKYVRADDGSADWTTAADSEAAEILGSANYNHFIELAYWEEDAMIEPLELEIGQTCRILSGGKVYESILTAISRNAGIITLTFGTIRIDLTKIIRKGMSR